MTADVCNTNMCDTTKSLFSLPIDPIPSRSRSFNAQAGGGSFQELRGSSRATVHSLHHPVNRTPFLSFVQPNSVSRLSVICRGTGVGSLVAVARYYCAVVGSPSVRHVRSSCSFGSEKLVVVENV